MTTGLLLAAFKVLSPLAFPEQAGWAHPQQPDHPCSAPSLLLRPHSLLGWLSLLFFGESGFSFAGLAREEVACLLSGECSVCWGDLFSIILSLSESTTGASHSSLGWN